MDKRRRPPAGPPKIRERAVGLPRGKTGGGDLRLSRYLAQSGVAGRRAVDEMIRQGRVTVDGKIAVLGQKVRPGRDRVRVDGRIVGGAAKPVYILLNKPPGCLSTCRDPHGRKTVLSFLGGVRARVYPVGRLDWDSEGLLLLTNDGDFAYLMTHPKYGVTKEYLVWVDGPRDDGKLQKILGGLHIGDRLISVDYARFEEKRGLPLGLVLGVHQGEKHLVKNICHAVGYEVNRLIRLKMGPLGLGTTKQGQWRYLSEAEVGALCDAARTGKEGERGS